VAAHLLVMALLYAAPDAGVPPRALQCLPQWYAGRVAFDVQRGWGLSLVNGEFVPWHNSEMNQQPDGGVADAGVLEDAGVFSEEGAALTALEEIFAVPYVPGPIRAIDASDAGDATDPGRARVEALLKATYGDNAAAVSAQLAKVHFFGIRYPFHRQAAGPLERVVKRIEAQTKSKPELLNFLKPIGGTFVWRRILRSKALSSHAFGIAIDLNVAYSNYWRWRRRFESTTWRNRIPQEIVDAFEAEGFIWGGRWKHYDTMHFEYRPELLSPACTLGQAPRQ
jgi:D-alanyl-D-alanine carboxypeptidase